MRALCLDLPCVASECAHMIAHMMKPFIVRDPTIYVHYDETFDQCTINRSFACCACREENGITTAATHACILIQATAEGLKIPNHDLEN
jgi:hypothetical protein